MRGTILCLVLVLAACEMLPVSIKAPITSRFISREQAISAAVRIASSSAPEISGPLAIPSNIQAQQIPLSEAIQQMLGDTPVPTSYRPDMPVWYVTMDGLWVNEMPVPGMVVKHGPYHHYRVVLDAVTGMEIESSLRP
jgi:hypothetical protein